MTIPLGMPITAIANSPLLTVSEMVDAEDDSETREDGLTMKAALYYNQFILNSQLAVKARDVERHRMLKEALHAHVRTVFDERLNGLIDEATDELYQQMMAPAPDPEPDEWEWEADTPEGLDLPPPDDD